MSAVHSAQLSEEARNHVHLLVSCERKLVYVKVQRSEKNGCEDEVTVTSHKQRGQMNRKGCVHFRLRPKTKTRTQSMVLKHGGVTDESGCVAVAWPEHVTRSDPRDLKETERAGGVATTREAHWCARDEARLHGRDGM